MYNTAQRNKRPQIKTDPSRHKKASRKVTKHQGIKEEQSNHNNTGQKIKLKCTE